MPRDLATPPPEFPVLTGPAGRLGATFERPAGPPVGAVLHLHPHPLGGGTRRNNVVRHGALGALDAGCLALRIDFRGAGDSEGVHDEGRGEVEDAAAALDWLAARAPGLPLFVWGFSFGSRVGLVLSGRERDRLAGYLGVGFPNGMYGWPETPWPRRAAFLVGEHDEFADLDDYGPAREHGAPLTVVPGADHFFRGHLDEVRRWTAATLEEWLDELP